MGIVEEVGPEVHHIAPGDRVVVPFNISCGSCWMCERGLFAQCETTQNRADGQGRRAVRLHRAVRLGARRAGGVPAGPAGALRPDQGARTGTPDERFLFLSDILPTAWQAVAYADAAPRRHPGGARAGPGRPVLRPDRPAPRRVAGDRRSTPCPSGSRWPGDTASRRSTPRAVDDVAEAAVRADGGARTGRGDRRRRDGGARLARRASSPTPSSACCPTRWHGR